MNDTIIIGAGFAGLSTAHALQKSGHSDFVILEARDRVGGRTKPGNIAGHDIDLGGMWLGGTQTRLKALADRYQAQTYPTHLEGLAVFRIQGKEHHGPRENIDGLFGLWEGFDYLRSRRKLQKLMDRIDCENPWDHPSASRLDTTTVEQWLQSNVRSERLRILYRLTCFSLFCAESSQISPLFYLYYIKSGDGFDAMLSADAGGAQHMLVHGGVHRIAREMGEEVGDRLRLNEPVRRIDWRADGVSVETDQNRYEARHAVIAVPPTLLSRIEFSPSLPQPKAAFHARLNMGCAIKFWVVYEEPFWRQQGFNGFIVRDDCPATPVMDVSPPGQPHGILAGFFDGDHALQHGDLPSDQRRRLVLSMLSEHFGEKATSPIDYIDNDWTAEQWSGGCYGAYAAPGTFSHYGKWLREPIGPLHWAGTETSPRWTGYIEGAIRSGERAAEEIIQQPRTTAVQATEAP